MTPKDQGRKFFEEATDEDPAKFNYFFCMDPYCQCDVLKAEIFHKNFQQFVIQRILCPHSCVPFEVQECKV